MNLSVTNLTIWDFNLQMMEVAWWRHRWKNQRDRQCFSFWKHDQPETLRPLLPFSLPLIMTPVSLVLCASPPLSQRSNSVHLRLNVKRGTSHYQTNERWERGLIKSPSWPSLNVMSASIKYGYADKICIPPAALPPPPSSQPHVSWTNFLCLTFPCASQRRSFQRWARSVQLTAILCTLARWNASKYVWIYFTCPSDEHSDYSSVGTVGSNWMNLVVSLSHLVRQQKNL